MLIGPMVAGFVAAIVLVVLRKLALDPETVPVTAINSGISFVLVFVMAYFLAPEATAAFRVMLSLAAVGTGSLMHATGKWVKKKVK
jgi:hypothetical protein